MFCDGCGTQIQDEQRFCPTCGKPVGIAVVPYQTNRVASHRQLLGILWVVYSFLVFLGAGILFVLANTLFGSWRPVMTGAQPVYFPSFLQPLLSFVSVALLCKAILGIIAGVGLLQRQHWARMIAIVAAFFALLSIPFGTALGIYTLVVLMSQNAEQEYAKIAPAA
jgi:zinc-ribbon domain